MTVAAIVVAVILAGIGFWMVLSHKSQSGIPKQQISTGNQAKTLRTAENGIEYVVNPKEVKYETEINSGDSALTRKPDDGNRFVTVVVQVKNTTDADKSLYAMNQVLVTRSGEHVRGDAGLQLYVKNGKWYETAPANGSVSGTFVFEIGKDDEATGIEFHSGLGTNGATIDL